MINHGGRKTVPKTRDEAEKPFWISFSDLMTALMVLFLVAMTVALLAVTQAVSETESRTEQRKEEINLFLLDLSNITKEFPGVSVSVSGQIIDFGDRARFETNSHRLGESQSMLLSQFVPRILALAESKEGKRWLKRIAVEGFADARGSYLHNLNLSLQRSERVLCALLLPSSGNSLTEEERRAIKKLFVVSGASFNALRNSPEESRRIELRLEFLQLDESPVSQAPNQEDMDKHCPLDTR